MTDLQIWKRENGKFVKITGTDVGTAEEYDASWMCHGCGAYAADYKLVSRSRSAFGLYCRSCLHMDFTVFRFGDENKDVILKAL